MIYTEVLPFVWLAVAFGAALFVLLASTVSVFSPVEGDTATPVTVPFAASPLCPAPLAAALRLSYDMVVSHWAFWPLYAYTVAKLSHNIARGRNCRDLQQRTNLSGKVAIVTGANSGIGYYTAMQLAEMGATVILSCRSAEKAAATAQQICDEVVAQRGGMKRARPNAEGATNSTKKDSTGVFSRYGHELRLRTDFSIEMDDFVSVRRFCSRFIAEGLPLHFLVNNAGMMTTSLAFSKFNPDLELHMAVNFMGPLLLTELLWGKLCETSEELAKGISPSPSSSSLPSETEGLFEMTRSRVIFVASEAHQFPTMDPSFQWFDSKAKQPLNRSEASTSTPSTIASPFLEAFVGASKGSENSTGPIITPRVSKTMAGFVRYGFSKLGDIFLAHHFANRPAATDVSDANLDSKSTAEAARPLVVALHPGLIASSFANNILSFYQYLTFITMTFQKTSEEGSQTTVFACICDESDAAPHPRGRNPYWRETAKDGEKASPAATTAPQQPTQYPLASRYLAECADYSFSAMKPVGWALDDARDVVEWARREILKV